MKNIVKDTADRVVSVGTMYRGRKEFVEGTPDQIAEDHRERARTVMIEAARSKDSWYEIDPESLERVRGDRLISDNYNVVLERMKTPVWAGGDPTVPLNEHSVWGWYLGSDGYPVFLQLVTYGPRTPTTVRAQEATRLSRIKMAELDAKAALITTPLLPVTLAELEGRELPTLRAAAEIVNESGKLELVGDHLRVHLRVRGDREIDAARVLYGAEQVVVDAIRTAGAKKDVSLPDVEVLAGGGVA